MEHCWIDRYPGFTCRIVGFRAAQVTIHIIGTLAWLQVKLRLLARNRPSASVLTLSLNQHLRTHTTPGRCLAGKAGGFRAVAKLGLRPERCLARDYLRG